VALRMRLEGVQILRGVHELPLSLSSRAVTFDLDLARLADCRVEQKQIRAGVVHDATSIRRGMSHVEIFVARVTLYVPAGRRAGIQIANRLVVGEEIDPRADPKRARQIAFEINQPTELALPRRIDPQIARGAAAIPFPARGVERVATNDTAAIRPEGDRLGRPCRQQLRRAAVQANRPQTRRSTERLLRIAAKNDFPSSPSDDQRIRPKKCEPSRLAALGGHHVNFKAPLIASTECKPFAVG